MMKKISPKYTINYDTKWTHQYLKPEQALYFKAKTPIQDIIPELENFLNQNTPVDLKADYKRSYIAHNFSRLYRNFAKSYKKWQVLYREPGSKTDYGPIRKQIGHKNPMKIKSNLKSILAHRMFWKHDLDPAVKRIEINKANNCGFIARQLNQQFSEVCFDPFLKKWLPYVEALNKNFHELLQKDHELDVLKDKNARWQTFLNNLQMVNDFSQQLKNVFASSNYMVSHYNVYDVLTLKNKNTKGWQVEFLD